MKPLTYRVIIEPDENNTFHGFVPTLPGCHTWGNSIGDVKKKIREAMDLYIEDLIEDGEELPIDESYESFETILIPDAGGLSYA